MDEKEKSITEDPMALSRFILDNLETGNYTKLSLDQCIREAEERVKKFEELKNIVIVRLLPGSNLKKF